MLTPDNHERLSEDEALTAAQWLSFLRHHPDLYTIPRKLRHERTVNRKENG